MERRRGGTKRNKERPATITNNFFESLHVASLILKDCNYGNGGGRPEETTGIFKLQKKNEAISGNKKNGNKDQEKNARISKT